jgi:transcriptional regulator with XRE-family HTH domain
VNRQKDDTRRFRRPFPWELLSRALQRLPSQNKKRTKDERRKTKDERRKTKDERRKTKDERRKTKDESEGYLSMEVRDPRQPDDVDVEVGRRVRIERIARGLSQTELADRIGVSFQQVQKYESGANRISMGRLTRIGRVFGVDATYLLGASNHRARTAEPTPRKQTELSEAMRMLGRIGAVRLLRAFVAIPPRPASLRESIVQVVEGASAAAARVMTTRKRAKRR